MLSDYNTKVISIRDGQGYKTIYLLAVPYTECEKSGFRIYATDLPEKFYAREHQPLIGAMLFETVQQAMHAGELVLRHQSRFRRK